MSRHAWGYLVMSMDVCECLEMYADSLGCLEMIGMSGNGKGRLGTPGMSTDIGRCLEIPVDV